MGAVQLYNSYHYGGRPLSDERSTTMSVGLPPKVIDAVLLRDQKQVDTELFPLSI